MHTQCIESSAQVYSHPGVLLPLPHHCHLVLSGFAQQEFEVASQCTHNV